MLRKGLHLGSCCRHQTAVVWAQELAVGLIKDQFGDVVGGVASQLVYSGPHTFIQLLRASSLAPPLLKQALLVLLQHNCVAAYKVFTFSGATIQTLNISPWKFLSRVHQDFICLGLLTVVLISVPLTLRTTHICGCVSYTILYIHIFYAFGF